MSEIGKSILQGASEVLEYAKGQKKGFKVHKVKVPREVDVFSIRKHLAMNRKEFCENFGFSIRTVEKWERHERTPEASARAYLTVIDSNPNVVKKALSGNH